MNGLLRIALEASLRAAAVALCVGAILALAKTRSGAMRHGAWTAVLCAMLLMPVLPYVIPAIGLPAGAPRIARVTEAETAVPEQPLALPDTQPQTAAPARVAVQSPAPYAPPTDRTPLWPWAAIAAYLAGALVLLTHLEMGWRSARRILRAAEPVDAPFEGIAVYESGAVASPVTVGILKPCILLPRGWSEWPEAKLRAVLAHEAAHVRRRDALVAFAARLNRCLFWFHPLAWWLERRLASTAEMAADEAGVHAAGERRVYAEVLLDIAAAVRRNGGRLAWEGVAMDGEKLENRIDRVLRADFLGRASLKSKALVAVGCAAAIFLAAACREKSDSALIAQSAARDKDYQDRAAKYMATAKAEREYTKAALALTNEQVAALEASLRTNPDDFDARKKLLTHYNAVALGEPAKRSAAPYPEFLEPLASNTAIGPGLPHYFWMIEHHPEEKLAARWLVGVFPTPKEKRPDPANLERARKLWQAQAEKDGQPAMVYYNAYEFFNKFDKPEAEKMLLRAQAADPKGEVMGTLYGGNWLAHLGSFYGGFLARADSFARMANGDPAQQFVARWQGPVDPNSSYAAEVRKKVEGAKDVTLLLWVAQELRRDGRRFGSRLGVRKDSDPEGASHRAEVHMGPPDFEHGNRPGSYREPSEGSVAGAARVAPSGDHGTATRRTFSRVGQSRHRRRR